MRSTFVFFFLYILTKLLPLITRVCAPWSMLLRTQNQQVSGFIKYTCASGGHNNFINEPTTTKTTITTLNGIYNNNKRANKQQQQQAVDTNNVDSNNNNNNNKRWTVCSNINRGVWMQHEHTGPSKQCQSNNNGHVFVYVCVYARMVTHLCLLGVMCRR